MLATLFLTTTHLPGVVALAAPQIFARVGPGASNFPANFAAFTDPTFGEIGDAINVANGNAYFQTANVNWNNLNTSNTGTANSASKTQTNGVLRLYGFNSAHGSPVAAEYALGQGDGSQQLFRRATEDEINTGPSWIRERYAGIRAGVTFFISK
ncbi:hypothetical protein, partial [Deinococcus aquaedulcis]|uniref:hypothetical protein n=1 Tax=Deinococcus aquaedulcis TaxID=2840455 RepID=UPI001C831F4B